MPIVKRDVFGDVLVHDARDGRGDVGPRQRQLDTERGAAARTSALRSDHTAVEVHDVPREHEPESRPFHDRRNGAVWSFPVEHVRQDIVRDAQPGVRHGESGAITGAAERHRHPAPVRREANRVGEEVPQHLPESGRIARHHADRQSHQRTVSAGR